MVVRARLPREPIINQTDRLRRIVADEAIAKEILAKEFGAEDKDFVVRSWLKAGDVFYTNIQTSAGKAFKINVDTSGNILKKEEIKIGGAYGQET